MKRKLAVFFLSAAIACCGAAIISSCGQPSDDASNSGWSVQTAYAQAVDLGFEGTLEEFLALIEGEEGADGRDGVGIESATINDKGELVLTYTDGNTVNLGKVTGTDGQDGQNGTDGTDGEDGKDGVGIKSATINDKGELVLIYTDGNTVNLGKVTGSDGQNGADGEDGKDGLNGADGVGISKIYIEEGHLFIQLTDKNVVDCGALPSGVPCVHSYGEWVTEQQPTCMSIGAAPRAIERMAAVHRRKYSLSAIAVTDGLKKVVLSIAAELTYARAVAYVMQPHLPDKEGNCACDYGLEYALAEDGLSYIVTDIINFSGTTLEIPAMHNGLPVSDMQAGLYENIKSIIVPETLKAISGNTQSIQKVYISDLSAWIGVDKSFDLSFSDIQLYLNDHLIVDYIIPEGTTRIGAYSYSDYLSLESITIPASVTEIGEWAFQDCTSLKVVKFEEGSRLKTIGVQAFKSCAITEVTIPASVVTIENAAFQSCNLLESVNFEENSQLQIFSGFKSCDNLKKLVVPDGVTRITNISGNKSLAEITIPQSVIQIGGMSGNTSLKEIFIPKNVELISGVAAFGGCTSLETVTFEEGSKLQSIGERAFSGCTALTSITIPANVTELVSRSFENCSSLENVIFEKGIEFQSIGEWAFSGCTALTSIIIPANVTELGSSVFEGCISLKSVEFEEGNELKSIPSRAFYGCSALLQIAIPANVTEICEYSFTDCAALTSIFIPQGVDSIGNGAFAECASLPYIIIPTSVKTIGMYAFNTYNHNGGTISIYYNGTSGEWSKIQKGEYSCGVVYFYSATQPVDTGYFWHYAEDGVTPLVW